MILIINENPRTSPGIKTNNHENSNLNMSKFYQLTI